MPMYCAARGRRLAVHRSARLRRGLQPLSHGPAGRVPAPTRQAIGAGRCAGRRPAQPRRLASRCSKSRPVQFTVLTFVAVVDRRRRRVRPDVPRSARTCRRSPSVKPYTPLELEGRDLYIREGCVSCHSQMIRPFRAETERYGDYSKAGEFVYDHPFLWGSKRTGPDLQREGGKYPDAWHFVHMKQPSATSPRLDHAGVPAGSTTRRWIPRTSRARSSRCAGWACRIRTDTNAAPRPT